MGEQNSDWKPDKIKLEPEVILKENDKRNDYFIDSCKEAKYQIPSSTFQEQTENVSKNGSLNFMSSLPSTTSPMPSTSEDALEGTLKIKEEKIEDEDLLADPFLLVGQKNPTETATSTIPEEGSAFSPERIYIKMEDDFEERNVAEEEHQELEFIDAQEVERGSDVKMEDDFVERNGTTKNDHRQLDFVNAEKVGATVSNNTVDSAGLESKDIQYYGVPFAVGTNVVYYLVNKTENFNSVINGSQSVGISTTSVTPPLLDNLKNDVVKPNKLIPSPSSNLYPHLVTPLDKKTLACERCSAGFQTESDLRVHLLKTHCDEGPFSCCQCSAQFISKQRLRSHMLTHSNERTFSCDQCSAQFKRKANLKSHLTTHSDENAFSCEQCSATFKRKIYLERHLLTHSDERAFACDQCSARFKRKAHLQDHLLIHSNEKAISCNRCSAQFKTKANLNYHMLKHSNKKAFSCSQCSIEFIRKSELKQHLLTHSNEKPYSCTQCSARFKRKADLKGHSRIHSPKKVV